MKLISVETVMKWQTLFSVKKFYQFVIYWISQETDKG